jgi:calcineurin-like phosphoesterase family protein
VNKSIVRTTAILAMAVSAAPVWQAKAATAAGTAATPLATTTATLLAAGDISSCGSSGDTATAALIKARSGTVAPLGDNVYENGSPTEYTNCYGPTWGAFKSRSRPTPGNHDYNTAGARGYFGFFGSLAGDPTKGYYSYTLGSWHVVVINSNCTKINGQCDQGAPQERWLRADLAAHPVMCTLAYWHHPLFTSSSVHHDATYMRPIFTDLYNFGAELVLNGDSHHYERFAPQTSAGVADPAKGVREFVVGTGGFSHYGLSSPHKNSQVRNNTTFGVLQLTLRSGGYDWHFLPVAGKTFTDSGSTACH